jgi:hypothetical protein
MLAPLPLRPPVSTSRNPARMESAFAAWCCQQTARAAFSSRRHCKLYLVVLQCQPTGACMLMPPDPMPSSTPWGIWEETKE